MLRVALPVAVQGHSFLLSVNCASAVLLDELNEATQRSRSRHDWKAAPASSSLGDVCQVCVRAPKTAAVVCYNF